MKLFKNERGNIRVIFTLLIVALLFYIGIKFAMPYYRYSAFKSDVKEIARISLGEVERTKTMVFESAQGHKIPISEKDIKVTATEKTIRVNTSWSETVDILGIYQKNFKFKVNVEE